MRTRSFFLSPRGILRTFRFLFLVFVALAGGVCLCAQTPEDAVRGLARRVGEIREVPERVTVEWVNASSLPEAESMVLREAFLKEFSGHHAVGAATPAAVAGVRVSVRETPTEFLVVARVTAAKGEEVRMAELVRTAFLPVMTRGNGLRLTKQLLWQQAETILDAGEFAEEAASTGGAADIFLLKPEGVAIYRETDEGLSKIQELSFNGYRYGSRGLRGELHRNKDGSIGVAVPGLNCAVRGSAGDLWTMTCGWTSSLAETKVPDNAAPASEKNTHAEAGEAVRMISSCDGSWWRLLEGATDWTQAERLLLVNAEMKREEAVASLEFAGPVRRLAAAEDGKSAVAVVFNFSSGNYEIYRISLVCGR